MRPGQNNNFKNRNRNRNRRHNSGGGGGGGGGNPNNRVLDSNGPDVKLRGTAQTIAEKYMQMARDAHSSGDRVMAEAYYQHADHYYRLWLAAQPAGQPIQFSRRTEEDMEDGEGSEGEDDNTTEAANGDAADGGDISSSSPENEGQQGEEGGQNRNFRPRENRDFNSNQGGNRDQNGGNRFGRNRWPRRNERYTENREGGAAAADGPEPRSEDASQVSEQLERQDRQDRPERAPRRERVEAAPLADDAGDWEAPSFLKRPMPAVGDANGDDEGATAPVAERKPRGRRPRFGGEGPPAGETPASEE